jgi:N-acetylneuraminic acid mutarotase
MPYARRTTPRLTLVLTVGALGLAACGDDAPTQPGVGPALGLSPAAARNSWTPKAPTPYTEHIFGYDLAMAPNRAGESIVYAFGGTSDEENLTGLTVKTYNATTDTWAAATSKVGVFYSNGVGKIGGRLYFSGGYVENGNLPDASNRLWAYDYTNDRMIQKADLPIFSAEGVTGVIAGKLYVLPGACNGNGWPAAGYCEREETVRFYRYDPATDTWITRRHAPHVHRNGAAAVIDGELYAAGGVGPGLVDVAYLDVYSPATNTWRTLAPLPEGGHARGAALQGQFFVVVQPFSESLPPRAYAYDRKTNQWQARAVPDVFGSVTRVTVGGAARLFTASGDKSALYTP